MGLKEVIENLKREIAEWKAVVEGLEANNEQLRERIKELEKKVERLEMELGGYAWEREERHG